MTLTITALLSFAAGISLTRWYYKSEVRSLENTLQIKLNADYLVNREAPDAR